MQQESVNFRIQESCRAPALQKKEENFWEWRIKNSAAIVPRFCQSKTFYCYRELANKLHVDFWREQKKPPKLVTLRWALSWGRKNCLYERVYKVSEKSWSSTQLFSPSPSISICSPVLRMRVAVPMKCSQSPGTLLVNQNTSMIWLKDIVTNKCPGGKRYSTFYLASWSSQYVNISRGK